MREQTAPLLSIVIANYNYGRFLAAAIESILRQGMGDAVEIIICDAASTDNSVAVIKQYATHISWWCSEKDGGQSEAFNKGFRHAKGTWVTWLNADELYLSGTLKAFADLIRRHPHAQWVTGNDLSFDDRTGKITHVSWGPHVHPPYLRGRHAPFAVFGPTSFWRRNLCERIGSIDETLHFAMDFDYWIRLTMAGIRPFRLNHSCWAFRVHDASKTSGEKALRLIELRKKEFADLQKKSGYSFPYSVRNPWYLIWMLGRIFDGSLFVRAWKRRLIGRSIDEII